jgi:hypothetical protein
MMFDNIDADTDDVVYDRFFDKIRRERAEWLAQDLVVDMREGYKSWVWRQFNFEDAPLVPREELPANMQPQNSIRAKVFNYINGIDPRLPEKKSKQKIRNANNSISERSLKTAKQDLEMAEGSAP